jgi:hypothetical protein
MNSNKTQLFLVASIASVMVLAGVASEQAFAHGGQGFFVNLPNGESRQITVVIGHNNEPTTAQETGKSSGNHPMELFIRDSATGLNLADADLKVDKYYYKNDKKFNKAAEKGFEPRETDVTVSGVHGDPGHYFARQILAQPGIYGYHVTGTVSYFGVVDVPIDVKAFCRDAPSNDFTTLWFGGFGCTVDVDDSKFPGKKVKHDKDD